MDRYVGIDYGLERTGIAISTMGIAQPLVTISSEEIFKKLDEIFEEYRDIKGIVVGKPAEGKMKKIIDKFIVYLKRRYSIPIYVWDESFSTKKAEKIIREMKGKPSKEKERVDRIAASVILEEFLENR